MSDKTGFILHLLRDAFKHFRHGLVVSAVLILFGCGTAPIKEGLSGQPADIEISLEEVTDKLDYADNQDNDTRTRTYLNVTHALLEAEEIDWARNTLTQLSQFSVPEDQYIRYAVLSSALALAQGQAFRAKAFLWEDRLETIAALAPHSDLMKLYEMRARLLLGLREYRASIDMRLQLHTILDEGGEESDSNQDMLWQTLMELPYSDLKMESQIQQEMLAKGWYTLAALSKDNQTNLGQQISEVENWMLNWPEHPTSLRLPADLRLLKQLDKEKPNQIAILLPFSGRFATAAEAIRDGILAAYYEASSHAGEAPEVRIYDTSRSEINALYDEAALNGAQLIIGPLEQSKITELSLRPEIPVPILALNRISSILAPPPGLFQFGLSLEDEAEQVAQQAWLDGHRRTMILAPSSANGDRSVTSFRKKWLSLGGEITSDSRYKDQSAYSNLVKTALKVKESQQRRRAVRSLLGKPVEFEPRRRKDIDFIFLYSHATAARQIKPILAFHYAGDVPVYSVRNIYNGKIDTKRDRDLNDIRFTTLPWFFDKELPEKNAILQNINSTNYQFLYALGVDAYHIHPRLRQLKEVKQAHFYGSTGTLHLDESQKIRREQIWAKFSRGRAIPVTTFTQKNVL